MAAVDGDNEDLSWDENERNLEPTSSEDELLATCAVDEIEEAAAWLDAVGLGHIADRVLEGGNLVTDANLAKTVHEEGLTKRQYHTVQRRVETLRATVKSRKGHRGLGGAAYQQRPDCRDIFRDRDASHSGGSSGRSRSATPDSLDSSSSRKTSTENLLHSSPDASPKSWSRSSSREDDFNNKHLTMTGTFGSLDEADGPLPPPITSDILLETRARLEPQPRRSLTQAERSVTFINVRPNLPGFFIASESPVAKADKNVEIVKYKSLGTLPLSHGRRNSNDPYEDLPSVIPIIEELPRTLEDGLSSGQLRKLRQLALLELTGIMDENNLPVRKRSRLQSVRNFAHSTRERQVFGVPLKKLTERDQSRTPAILEMMMERIKSDHLAEEGLLRVPGNKQKTAALQKLIESNSKGYSESKGSAAVRRALENAGPHELCSLLKQFLRLLPESLFTHVSSDLFVQVADLKKPEEQLKALNLLVVQLPEPNYHTLRSLLKFLNCIIERHASNRMNLNNVATVMGPNLFPPRVKSTKMSLMGEEMLYTAKTNRVTELLLTYQDELFFIPPNIYSQLKFLK